MKRINSILRFLVLSVVCLAATLVTTLYVLGDFRHRYHSAEVAIAQCGGISHIFHCVFGTQNDVLSNGLATTIAMPIFVILFGLIVALMTIFWLINWLMGNNVAEIVVSNDGIQRDIELLRHNLFELEARANETDHNKATTAGKPIGRITENESASTNIVRFADRADKTHNGST